MGSSLDDLVFKIGKILSNIANRVSKLETMAHPPRTFVRCEECKEKIREDNGNKDQKSK